MEAMKRNLLTATVLTLTGWVLMLAAHRGGVQAQSGPGPGDGGAVLKQPWETGVAFPPATAPRPATRESNVPLFAQPSPAIVGAASPARMSGPGLVPPQEGPDPNQDILVTGREGPWMIFVHWYEGPEAPQWAREFVMELRNTHKLTAYVFNRGAEERRKEYERVKGIIEKQRQWLKEKNLPLNQPIHVKYMRIEEQCAVLVGGYRDENTARRALEEIRKLKQPDPKKVKMHAKFCEDYDDKGKLKHADAMYVNPFGSAFVARNPAIKVDRSADRTLEKEDLEIFRRLNRDEAYSLLNCKKPFTLAIKQFHTPTVVQPQSAKGTFFEHFGGKSGDRVDTAALNAHNMAEVLRKAKFEAYVLHTKCSSIVTVGSFSTANDPALISTQRLLVEQYKVPQATPMQVPGAGPGDAAARK
jgi:hypothetical protein